ncbi:hypothetical protein G3580_06980 [Nitrogeniibacter mangrovi]|uniref:Uncharacterized protein n=1 Tax=Nitrogeniibacter mangrovi TaxID=2016596 RepID=A0A6C1B1C0_9RHOO|nr:hypothetical protein [Nitrogeniibacter mangrovi]QID17411.1 hypothetical protein G3580_06980 [Nitrogeniibacter mangrovi]
MSAPVTVIGTASPRPARSSAPAAPRERTWPLLLAVVVMIAVTATIGRAGLYEPGDDLGYYLGLSGALMMATLLLYPLRKRIRPLRRLGPMRHWFRYHMVFGIAGPILVLLHSTYRIESLNAGVALVSMALVAASGLIGRFLYVRIHHGLYGQRATLEEFQTLSGLANRAVRSQLFFVPEVEQALLSFERDALAPTAGPGRLIRFVLLGPRARLLYWRALPRIRTALRARAEARHWDRAKTRRRMRKSRKLVLGYLRAVLRVAQFNAFDRLFSLWHVVHVPLLYLLVLSAVIHVIAVHMY